MTKNRKENKIYFKSILVRAINLYDFFMLRTSKYAFCFIFNIKAFLVKSPARFRWDGVHYKVYDKGLPVKSYLFSHEKQGNMAYTFGLSNRGEKLGSSYMLEQIDFKHEDLVFDCGANVGDLKLWFESKNIRINYVGFEPSPIEFQCLKQNAYPHKAHNIGLWKTDGELSFYISSQGADSSLIEPIEYDERIEVQTKRLDNFIDGRVKLLKLEAEGAEPEILEGLGEKLRHIEYISADLGFERGKSSESTLAPVTNFLLKRGFELLDVKYGRICALYKNTELY